MKTKMKCWIWLQSRDDYKYVTPILKKEAMDKADLVKSFTNAITFKKFNFALKISNGFSLSTIFLSPSAGDNGLIQINDLGMMWWLFHCCTTAAGHQMGVLVLGAELS